ncbi:MAG: GNAT family N-acetyltransferase [bacterium]|nr:MAG: GNAT family N-acetyltransferase [bacterium]
MKDIHPTYFIRETRLEEVADLFNLVKKLAEYEKLLADVSASAELFRKNGFGEKSYFQSLLVENKVQSEARYLGFALYFFTFSTFLGKPTLYLEDLFVLPEYRGRGIGKSLLKTLARVAMERDCGRMEWSVLNWNKPAIDFYLTLHAKPMEEWTVYRLTAPDIKTLASQ